MNKIVEGLESEPPPLTPVDTAVGIEADFRKVSLPRDDNWAAGLVGRRVDLKEPTESDSDNPTLEPPEKRGKGIYGPGNVYEDHGVHDELEYGFEDQISVSSGSTVGSHSPVRTSRSPSLLSDLVHDGLPPK